MCGLACVIEFGDRTPQPEALDKLSNALVHRGPDDKGSLVHRNTGMVFRRLAIIDLSEGGHQPMLSDDGRYAIIFNGEIFNYLELRRELEGKGYVFRSSSDTEVLLNAYIEWKEACLDRLNGMWAFVMLDTESGACFGARDRFGVKPLYYFKTQERMVIASEASALLRCGLCRSPVNQTAVARYLFFGDLDFGTDTFYERIEAVAPGTWFTIDGDGRFRSGRHWELPEDVDESPDYRELAELFHNAVTIRLRSDVPVGVFLSGGLDSTSILCAAEAQLGREHPLNAYAFMATEYDETRYINDTIRQTNASLLPLTIDNDGLWDQLLSMTQHQDGPVHTPSALIGFCLCAMAARDGTKVILNGQGADETFAGYSSYFASYWQSLIQQLQMRTLVSQLGRYGAHHHIALMTLIRQIATRFAKVQLNRLRAYRWGAAMRHRHRLRAHPLYAHDLVGCLPRYRAYAGDRGLGEALRRSVTTDPLPLYLRVEDRNSMAHSIEVRLPFMDHRLVTAVMRIASTRKMDGFWNKVLLRESMRGRIPESVRTRPDKMGFETPDAKWIRAWTPQIETIFHSRSFAQRGFFNVPNLSGALKDHANQVRDCHEDIFRAVQVELYLRSAEQAV
ncbi:MAG: asparagine synthase (glutamine-hydrolyzing) [Gemmatimonadaceae bacterium]